MSTSAMLEAVVLAGGTEPRLAPLTSSENPKCLLPVANSPVILFSLKALKQAGISTVLVVRTTPRDSLRIHVNSITET
jgi:NDP-sugar pyrophosphorylase family protein